MFTHTMKPETVARRSAERVAKRAIGRGELERRLRAKVDEHGDDSIYAELLVVHINSYDSPRRSTVG
jgi:hypothetical protein